MDVELQPVVDKYGCRYFAENDTGNGQVLNVALRVPFVRLFTISRKPELVQAHRQRFQSNDRIQIFTWTHSESWDEVVRLLPTEQPSMFWIHSSEVVSRAVHTVARLRLARRDVLLVEPGVQRGAMITLKRYFSRTHETHDLNSGLLLLTPHRRRRGR
jgi:hypothetical protein